MLKAPWVLDRGLRVLMLPKKISTTNFYIEVRLPVFIYSEAIAQLFLTCRTKGILMESLLERDWSINCPDNSTKATDLLKSFLNNNSLFSLTQTRLIKYHSIQIHSSSLIVFSDGDGNDDEQLESTTNISSWFPSKRDSSSSGKRKSVTTWGHAMLQICPTSAILFTFSISCCPRETHMWIAQTGHDTFHFRQQEVVPYGQSVLTNGKRPKKNHNFLCAFMRVGLSDHEIWPHFCDFSGSQVVDSFS